MAASRSSCSDPCILAQSNLLLAAINVRDRTRLISICKYVDMPRGRVLHEAGEPMQAIWFPVAGLASVSTAMRNGTMVEVLRVGREGMLGVPAHIGFGASPFRCTMQFSGAALEFSPVAFQAAFQQLGSLQVVLRRYLEACFREVCLSAACNLLHGVKPRLAAWLFKTYEEIGSKELMITHQELSVVLGAERSTVTHAAHALELAEVIRYKHGKLTLLDVSRLEGFACECHLTAKRQLEDALGPEESAS